MEMDVRNSLNPKYLVFLPLQLLVTNIYLIRKFSIVLPRCEGSYCCCLFRKCNDETYLEYIVLLQFRRASDAFGYRKYIG